MNLKLFAIVLVIHAIGQLTIAVDDFTDLNLSCFGSYKNIGQYVISTKECLQEMGLQKIPFGERGPPPPPPPPSKERGNGERPHPPPPPPKNGPMDREVLCISKSNDTCNACISF